MSRRATGVPADVQNIMYAGEGFSGFHGMIVPQYANIEKVTQKILDEWRARWYRQQRG